MLSSGGTNPVALRPREDERDNDDRWMEALNARRRTDLEPGALRAPFPSVTVDDPKQGQSALGEVAFNGVEGRPSDRDRASSGELK
jgi:hypothetical protein